MKKWEGEQALLEPEFRASARPVKPEKLKRSAAGGGRRAIEEHNTAAAEAYNGNMSPCPHCGRTFLPERLPVHLRSCRANSSSKPIAGKPIPKGGGGSGGGGGGGMQRSPSPQKRGGAGRGGGERDQASRRSSGGGPQFLTCYICGK